MPQGRHRLLITRADFGYAEGAWNANVELSVKSITPTSGSLAG